MPRYPLINDITTTPKAPPRFSKEGMDFPDRFLPFHEGFYAYLKPLTLSQTQEVVLSEIKKLAESFGWKEVRVDSSQNRLEAVAITKWMRFRDDIVIELRTQDNHTEVHMRSRSRLGRGDFGANAKRIEAFLRSLASSFN